MLKDGNFWEVEEHAPLLRRNANYLNKKNYDERILQAGVWLDHAEQRALRSGNSTEFPKTVSSCVDPACQRIFELDAERTFSDPSNRKRMVTILCTVHQELKDYHQGVGFLVAFTMLFYPIEDVVKFVLLLHRHYVPGYFKSAPEAYVRDAKVFERLLARIFPEVSKRLSKMAPAEAFASKWWVGMCVHVLPFEALMSFFEGLSCGGHQFLFRFALSLVKNCEADLLDSRRDVSKVLATLRLDPAEYADTKSLSKNELPGSFYTNIVEEAITNTSLQLDAIDLEQLTADADEEMALAARKRKEAESKFESDDEIIFSDEE